VLLPPPSAARRVPTPSIQPAIHPKGLHAQLCTNALKSKWVARGEGVGMRKGALVKRSSSSKSSASLLRFVENSSWNEVLKFQKV